MSVRNSYCYLFMSLFLGACTAQSDIILPVQPARTQAEENYKQCVVMATARLMTTKLSATAVVRDSMKHCSGLRYSMLQAYPENWRERYAQRLDAEVYQAQLSLVSSPQPVSPEK